MSNENLLVLLYPLALWQIIQKVLFVMISFTFYFFSQPLQIRSPSSKSQSKKQHLSGSIQLKKNVFLPCNRNLRVQKFKRKFFNYIFFSVFKLIFHQSCKLYLFHQGRQRKLSGSGDLSGGKIVTLCCLNEYLDNPYFPKSATFFYFAGLSNLLSSATTSWNSSFKNSICNITPVEEN